MGQLRSGVFEADEVIDSIVNVVDDDEFNLSDVVPIVGTIPALSGDWIEEDFSLEVHDLTSEEIILPNEDDLASFLKESDISENDDALNLLPSPVADASDSLLAIPEVASILPISNDEVISHTAVNSVADAKEKSYFYSEIMFAANILNASQLANCDQIVMQTAVTMFNRILYNINLGAPPISGEAILTAALPSPARTVSASYSKSPIIEPNGTVSIGAEKKPSNFLVANPRKREREQVESARKSLVRPTTGVTFFAYRPKTSRSIPSVEMLSIKNNIYQKVERTVTQTQMKRKIFADTRDRENGRFVQVTPERKKQIKNIVDFKLNIDVGASKDSLSVSSLSSSKSQKTKRVRR